MKRYIILLGTNLGDRLAQLNSACTFVSERVGRVEIKSSVYETDAWGFEEQPAFLNQVISGMTAFSPEELISELLSIERDMGRVREGKWQPRLIDIDLLFLDDLHISTEKLELPHPMLHKRRFTLLPLSEIFPDFRHPVLRHTVSELLSLLDDPLEVRLYQKMP